MGKTTIAWTERTWNPVRGSTKISPGCAHCYAATFAARFRGVIGHPYEQGFDLRLVPEKLNEPATWRKPCRVFVNSMSDLFQEGVPTEFIEKICSTMANVTAHTFQVLTKRPERMRDMLKAWPWIATKPNIWWGVSVEDRKHGLPRVDILGKINVRNKFLSCEPLLESICEPGHAERLHLWGIDWVIVGGESGPKARPCNVKWIREILEFCEQDSVPCFVKQLGSNPVEDLSTAIPEADITDQEAGLGALTVQAPGKALVKLARLCSILSLLLIRGIYTLAHSFFDP